MKDTFLLALKFVLAALLLPLVIGATLAFQGQLTAFDPALRQVVDLGVLSYVLLKFFVYDFMAVYVFGQNIMIAAFGFLKPLVNVAPYVIPIYSMIILIAYAVAAWLGKLEQLRPYLLFLLAFTFAMHIILTAQDLYKKDNAPGKPNYFFGMGLVYIVDVFLMALLASLVLSGFSFPEYFRMQTGIAAKIYTAVFTQLFRP
jgi:hypothetical protein